MVKSVSLLQQCTCNYFERLKLYNKGTTKQLIFLNRMEKSMYAIYPTWGLYHTNWVELRIPHKLPCLEGALILY